MTDPTDGLTAGRGNRVGCDGACTSMIPGDLQLQCVLPNGHKGEHENQRRDSTTGQTLRKRWTSDRSYEIGNEATP